MDRTFFPLILAVTFLVFWLGTRDSLKKRSRTPYLADFVFAQTVPSGWTYGAHVEWSSNSDSVPTVACYSGSIGDKTCAVTNVTHTGDAWTADVATLSNTTFTFNIKSTLDSNTVSNTSTFAITCMLGHVPIQTSEGVKLAKDVSVGDKFVQNDGIVSQVVRVKNDVITEQTKMPDARLFAKDDIVITYWHKVLVNGEWVLPETAGWREITGQMALPLDIFHFELEKPSDVIVSGSTVLESLY
jgi:hypothetical protein